MFTLPSAHRTIALAAVIFAASYSWTAAADDMASFATGGYARGLRSKEMMRKIDANGDGRISRDEFMAYQNKIFDMMDASLTHEGTLSNEEMFANGGGNRH